MTNEYNPEENPFEDHHDAYEKAYDHGYKKGRADALKELMKGSPDGWAIWSESGGYYSFIDPVGRQVMCVYPSDVYDLKDLIGPKGVEKLKHQAIVPVKLVKMEVSGGE